MLEVYDVWHHRIVFENHPFRPSIRKREACVYKNLRWRAFSKVAFSLAVFHRISMDGRQTVGKNNRFQTKTDTC